MPNIFQAGFVRKLCLPALALFVACSAPNPLLRVIDLYGTPYERGIKHGRELESEIRVLLDQWAQASEMLFGMPFADIQKAFLAQTLYLESIGERTPDLLAEIHGIADGAGVDFDTIYLFQISEELGEFGRQVLPQNCTAIGINRLAKERPALIGQNMDPPTFLHGFPTLLRIHDADSILQSMVFTFPGFLGLNGINREGLALTCNSLPNYTRQLKGLPVAFIVRSVLSYTEMKSAERFLYKVPHGAAQAYILGSPERVVCLECTYESVQPFVVDSTTGLTFHTNHFLVDSPESIYCPRLKDLKDRVAALRSPLDLESAQKILRSRRNLGGRPISNVWTYGSTIMLLSQPPILYISPGRPDRNPYRCFAFDAQSHGL
ncbi:hypothetical protein JW992_12025 [candidate division KSB1 bacterium]|nr:hypothetical protein [candidate division KSB1 bacterium]